MTATPADRVEAFLDARAKMGGLDQELIYSVVVDGESHELTTDDLRALVATARVPGRRRQ